jgi:hypothetical protein
MRLKKIFAIITVIFLLALYGATLIFSLSDSPNAQYLFRASIFCTFVIPVLLYGGIAICKVFRPRHPSEEDDSCQDKADT